MTFPIHQIDAFTSAAFGGNPAAVCWLDTLRSSSWMQQVAAEMNLSETAFLSPRDDGFDLRWFTPTVEVSLCGHATLASSHFLWDCGRLARDQRARFHTLSGVLEADWASNRIEMDLPAYPLEMAEPPVAALAALGVEPKFVGRTHRRATGDFDVLIELESEEKVRSVQPDFARLGREGHAGWIITAAASSSDYDFVSRYFAPASGIDEDPVTGSAHCSLVPYWQERLGKTDLVAFQASRRGGTIYGRQLDERVRVGGEAVTVFRGELAI